MCMTKKEMDAKVADYRSLKALYKQVEEEMKAAEREIISFLEETEECAAVNKNGVSIRQYIGADYKATYSPQSRETVKADEVKKILSEEQYSKVANISSYKVLRIS